MLTLGLLPVFAAQDDGGGIGSLMPLLALLFFIISAVRAMRQAKRAKEQHETTDDESEEERRAREIRERLRRVIAERRGEVAPPPLAPREMEQERMPQPEPPRPATPPRPVMSPLDPFGGPAPRTWEDLKRKLTPPPPVAKPVPVPQPTLVDLKRNEPEDFRAIIIEQKEPELPRTISPAPAIAPMAGSGPAVPAAMVARRKEARGRLLGDLHGAESLRRAFLLREVLGPPVSMRR